MGEGAGRAWWDEDLWAVKEGGGAGAKWARRGGLGVVLRGLGAGRP